MSPEIVSAERLIHASAPAIFALLDDPAKHRLIDGSGLVRDPKQEGQHHLRLGSKFGMSMKAGLPYSMVSEVIEFVENELIAWQTRGPSWIGRFVGGRIWRYELEQRDDGTLVRETWDITQESPLTKPFVRHLAAQTQTNMARTLERIDNVLRTDRP